MLCVYNIKNGKRHIEMLMAHELCRATHIHQNMCCDKFLPPQNKLMCARTYVYVPTWKPKCSYICTYRFEKKKIRETGGIEANDSKRTTSTPGPKNTGFLFCRSEDNTVCLFAFYTFVRIGNGSKAYYQFCLHLYFGCYLFRLQPHIRTEASLVQPKARSRSRRRRRR